MHHNTNKLQKCKTINTVKDGEKYKLTFYLPNQTYSLLKLNSFQKDITHTKELNNVIDKLIKKNYNFRFIKNKYFNLLNNQNEKCITIMLPKITYNYLYKYAKEYKMSIGNVLFLLLQKTNYKLK